MAVSRRSPLDSGVVGGALLATIILSGIGIRLHRITGRSIWFDEASSWYTSQLVLNEMLASISRNNHVPLHYVMLKAWTYIFGDTLFAMRGLSVFLAGLTMLATYLFASAAYRVMGESDKTARASTDARWMGLFAASLIAVNICQIRMAWEIRMYSLGTALAVLSSWTLFRALDDGASSWRWSVHGLLVLLFAYTHHFALFSIAGQIIFLAGWFVYRLDGNLRAILRDRAFRCSAACYGIVALGWIPWLPILLRQNRQVQDGFFTRPFDTWDLLYRCFDMLFHGEGSFGYVLLAAAACVAVVALLAMRGGPFSKYVLCLFLVPFFLAAGVSAVGRNVFILRYLVFAQVFLLIGIAAVVTSIRNRVIRDGLALLILFNGVIAYVDSWLSLDVGNRPGIRAAVDYVRTNRRSTDQVVVNSPFLYFPTIYYYRDHATCRVYSDGSPFLTYEGRPITTSAQVINSQTLSKIDAGFVWVISSVPSHGSVRIPTGWALIDRQEFREVYGFQGTIVVEKFGAHTSSLTSKAAVGKQS